MSTLRRFISHQLSTLTKVSHSESIHSLWPRAPQRGCACLLSDKVVCTYMYNRQPSLHIIHVHVHVHVLCTCTCTCTFQSLWSTHSPPFPLHRHLPLSLSTTSPPLSLMVHHLHTHILPLNTPYHKCFQYKTQSHLTGT